MTKTHELRCFDYVNHPYAPVRARLAEDAAGVFHAATMAASSRAESVAAALHVEIAGVDIGADVVISVREIEDIPARGKTPPTTRIALDWEAAKAPRLFPLMHAELRVYPLTATETQLDLLGRYEPPLGAVGSAVNAVVGHRIAEASVHRFLAEVAEYLRSSPPPPA